MALNKIKIAHTADWHIRPYLYFDEFKFTFDRFLESVVKNNVDIVVLCGDIYHNKLTVSNEYFDFAHKCFKELYDITNIVCIIGNHDVSISNESRMDAVSPIFNALAENNKNEKKLSLNSESFALKKYPHVKFHHFSIFDDKSKWVKSSSFNKDDINIVLYHGAVNNCIVDNGWVSRGNRDDINIFEGATFGMLGDIHKCQFLTDDKRIAYPGSLRQNNFGEDVDKGYLLWDISSKDDFKVERVILPQKRYFFTIHLTNIKDLSSVGDLPLDCRIRVKALKPLDLADEIQIKETIIEKYKPQGEVLIIQPEEDVSSLSSTTKVGNLDIVHENIRSHEIQKQLIKEYFQKKDVPQEKIDKIIELDKVYHSSVDTDVLRNVVYNIKNLKMDNFLSYGKDNEINFDKLNGLIGILGRNGQGKSSVFDAIFFLLQNGVYREGANKNGDYINRKCKRMDLKMEISMLNNTYVIERGVKKIYVKDKDEPKIENEVNFYKLPKTPQSSLNGESTPETNKHIKDLFGTKEDLELTSLASQFGLTSFIDARGTKRKESFAKFFDLGVFDTKFDLALKDHKEIKNKLKDCNKDELIKISKLLEEEIFQADTLKEYHQEQIDIHQEIIEDFDKELMEYKGNIVPVKSFTSTIEDKKSSIKRLEFSIDSAQKGLDLSVQAINLAKEKLREFKPVVAEYERSKAKLPVLQKQAALIKTIPGEEICKTCSLSAHAYKAKNDYDALFEQMKLDSEVVDQFKKTDEYLMLADNIELMKRDLVEAQQSLAEMEDHQDQRNENASWQKKIDETIVLKKNCQQILADHNKKLMDIIGKIATNKSKLEEVNKKIKVETELTSKDEIYSLYLDAMGKNGISYWIVSKKLSLINKLVNQILSFAVPFRFSVEDNEEEKSIKIYVIDEKGKRPVELCSGGEKTLVAIALRAALWKVCLLPKTPMLILDESLSFLDADWHDSVIKLLNYLKKDYFKQIFLITHNEELKRVVDTSIVIDKKKGFSFVEVK